MYGTSARFRTSFLRPCSTRLLILSFRISSPSPSVILPRTSRMVTSPAARSSICIQPRYQETGLSFRTCPGNSARFLPAKAAILAHVQRARLDVWPRVHLVSGGDDGERPAAFSEFRNRWYGGAPRQPPAPANFRCWKHSLQKTGRPCVGRKGTVVSFPQAEHEVWVSTRS